jgi:hypothetical protein
MSLRTIFLREIARPPARWGEFWAAVEKLDEEPRSALYAIRAGTQLVTDEDNARALLRIVEALPGWANVDGAGTPLQAKISTPDEERRALSALSRDRSALRAIAESCTFPHLAPRRLRRELQREQQKAARKVAR